jgi:anti-sigma regulatory factor (Ser/Thr protein kinase)
MNHDGLELVAKDLMEATFRHEAAFYLGEDEFMAGTLPFVRSALYAEEPILVAVDEPKIARMRDELAEDAPRVRFVDMMELGRNPARIISAWCDFVDDHRDEATALRGIGEPAWPGRSEAELVECHHHESLLNLAFADGPEFSLLCPYDVRTLDVRVVSSALRTHPLMRVNGTRRASNAYVEPHASPSPFEGRLATPAGVPDELRFGPSDLPLVRRFASEAADRFGATRRKAWDLTFAANELATNTLRHAGTSGSVRIWREGESVLCEVSDGGRIEDPLVGRLRPAPDAESGRGLWLVNQLCDLVQIRCWDAGNLVRVRVALH